MVKQNIRKSHKVHYAGSGNNLIEEENDSSSNYSEPDGINKSSHQIKTDILTNNVTKLLEKEGLYKFERKERGGHRKTVDYANSVVKHTAKFITFVGGEELLKLPIVTIMIIMSIIKIIIKRLHVSVVNRYCDHLSEMGFSSSKQF